MRNYSESTVLASGDFDEIESHNSFLEALNAWRGVSSTPKAIKTVESKKLHGELNKLTPNKNV